MSPRALTGHEKDFQRRKLLAKAREQVLTYGIRKVSVDDIVKAAGMAKGSFYHYFASKEDLLMQLVWEIYQGFIGQAEQIIRDSGAETIRKNVAEFLRSIISDPAKSFFFQNHSELEDLLATMDTQDMRNFNQLEQSAFAKLITLAGKNPEVVIPGVVHNYLHAMYFASSDETMSPEYMEETINAMLAGLMVYIFGPEETI